jgi:sirohydrochlorin ferrochelatase
MVLSWVKSLSDFLGEELHLAWLEVDDPDLLTVLRALSDEHDSLVIQPLLLFASGHAQVDVPQIVEAFHQEEPGVEVKVMPCLGMREILLSSWKDMLSKRLIEGRDLWLLGRGSKTAEVISLFDSLHGELEQHLGVKVGVLYSGLQQPGLEETRKEISQSRAPLLIPCLLFDGLLLDRCRVVEGLEIAPVLSEIPLFNEMVCRHVKSGLSQLV